VPGYGVDLFEDNYLFLLSVTDLRMEPALRPRPVSSVAFAYLGNTPQIDHSIERRHIYSPSVFRCDIHSIAQIAMCFLILRIFDNPPGYFCLHVEHLWVLKVPMGFWIVIGITGLLSASVFGLVIETEDSCFVG
jgi:hypothetical protein